MSLPIRARLAGILAICLLMLGAPGALAGCGSDCYKPDASIHEGSSSYVGEGVFLPLVQAASGTGVIGDKLTFWIKIKNVGALADTFKVKRSSGYTNGYRVRYYNAAGTDVTGKVNVGSFTTPSLGNGEEYVMRATVKVRSLATEGSSTSRLITVSSVNLPAAKDAVRFIAGVGTPNLTLSPGLLDTGSSYDFYFGAVWSTSQLFTVTNSGTGPSDVLSSITVVGDPDFTLGTDDCTGAVLPAGGTCSFQVVFTVQLPCDQDLRVATYRLMGGVPANIQYLDLVAAALCFND